MTISKVGTADAWVAGTTSTTPTLGTHAAGDMLVVFVFAKPTATGTPPVFVTPSGGWAAVTGAPGTSGDGVAQGTDVGQTWHTAYFLLAAGSGTTAPVVNVTNGNVCLGTSHIYRKTEASWDTLAGGTGADTSDGTGFSITTTTIALQANDMVAFGECTAGNLTRSAQGIAATGMTFGTYTEVREGTTNNGNDLAAGSYQALITAGTLATVAVTHTATLSAATANQTHGSGCAVRLREVVPASTPSYAFPCRAHRGLAMRGNR
jgi:hypothetical protein